MGAFVPGAEDALEVSTMARPTQTRHFGRAISFVRGLFGTSRDSLLRQAIDRLLDAAPLLTTLKLHGQSLCVSPMAAFNLVFQTIVLTSSTLLGMVVIPHTMRPIIYQRLPRRWQRTRKFMEWFRLVFSPINLHSYFLMATAQIYTQGKLALGLPIAHTSVTRK
jgi:hypothetical protein